MRKILHIILIVTLIEGLACQGGYCLSDSPALRPPLISSQSAAVKGRKCPASQRVQLKIMREKISKDELLSLFKQVSLGTPRMGHVKVIDERLGRLKSIFSGLGIKCELHNLTKKYMRNTLEKGVRPTERGLLGGGRDHVSSVVYDLNVIDYVYQSAFGLGSFLPPHIGIMQLAGSVIEGGGLFGYNTINDISAVLIDPNDPLAWDNAKETYLNSSALSMDGYIYRDTPWEDRVKVLLGIDLSLSRQQDSKISGYIDRFVNQSDCVQDAERKELAVDRLRHATYVYIWLGRFVRALEDYASFTGQQSPKKYYRFNSTIISTKPDYTGLVEALNRNLAGHQKEIKEVIINEKKGNFLLKQEDGIAAAVIHYSLKTKYNNEVVIEISGQKIAASYEDLRPILHAYLFYITLADRVAFAEVRYYSDILVEENIIGCMLDMDFSIDRAKLLAYINKIMGGRNLELLLDTLEKTETGL